VLSISPRQDVVDSATMIKESKRIQSKGDFKIVGSKVNEFDSGNLNGGNKRLMNNEKFA
jgi:hypothetical protein